MPAVMMPSCFSGRLRNTFPFHLNSDKGSLVVLAKYFVIVVVMLLGSDSSSPSNAHPSARPLEETIEDRLYLALHVKKLATYIGFSMGRLPAYHVGVISPD